VRRDIAVLRSQDRGEADAEVEVVAVQSGRNDGARPLEGTPYLRAGYNRPRYARVAAHGTKSHGGGGARQAGRRRPRICKEGRRRLA
jgi:hypothetical protein